VTQKLLIGVKGIISLRVLGQRPKSLPSLDIYALIQN
jgi:hypothetical protein